MKTHKDNAHKLETDLADAEKARAELLRSLDSLETEVVQRSSELDALRAQLEQLSQLNGALQVLKAKRETTGAENTKRKASLAREVQGTTLQQLMAMQVRFYRSSHRIAMRDDDCDPF